MKHIGVIGHNGKLGSLLCKREGFVALDCDITSPLSIEKAIKYANVDFIVNCASISSIDECEENPQKAIDVNVLGLANLHKVFGSGVLNISSDHVFSGRNWFLPSETTELNPINFYGSTKLAAEGVSSMWNGKTIRLSRTVSINDEDIWNYLDARLHAKIKVPTFFRRNYIHQDFAVDGIEFFMRNWDNMPKIVNYAGTDNVSMYNFILRLYRYFGLDTSYVQKENTYDTSLTPRPQHGGFSVGLANRLGFPMYSLNATLKRLTGENEKG